MKPTVKAAVLISFIGCCPLTVAQQGDDNNNAVTPKIVQPQRSNWVQPPQIPGLSAAWLLGSESAPGLYSVRVRLEKNAIIPPHTHPDERHTVVIRGSLYVGFGDSTEKDDAVKVTAGSVYAVPAGIAHYIWAKDESVEYQEFGMGPSGTNMVQQ